MGDGQSAVSFALELIADAERGTNGFGNDVIFFRKDLARTFGEGPPAEKNARSHRAAAVLAPLRRLSV